jgi:peptidoglycan/LPS O-acetylase OafA/YrhL
MIEAGTRPSGPATRTPRIRELDALRGIAALMVVLFHYTVTYDSSVGHGDGFWFSFDVGSHGVELFFMISGFVIFMTLERARSGGDFVLARFSRLFPAYWCGVLLTSAALVLVGLPGYAVSWRQLLANLTMFQNFLGEKNIEGVYWTLAIELAFYGWMLLVLKLGLLRRIDTLLAGWLAALFGVAILFTTLGVQLPWGAASALLLYHGHLFVAGILFHQLRSAPSRRRVALLGATFALEWLFRPESILIVGCWYLLFALLVSGRLTILNRQPLLLLGAISYPLYLLHETLGWMVIRQLYAWGIEDTLVLVLVPLALSIALASAVHTAVEVPAQRAIRGWVRRRGAGDEPSNREPAVEVPVATRAVAAQIA